MEECEDYVETKIFIDKNLAYKYLKEKISELKNDYEQSEDYTIEEDDKSYSRYLNERYYEDSISIWIEEDETYDEKQKNLENDKNEIEVDYEV